MNTNTSEETKKQFLPCGYKIIPSILTENNTSYLWKSPLGITSKSTWNESEIDNLLENAWEDYEKHKKIIKLNSSNLMM